jgi:hypothetical protein
VVEGVVDKLNQIKKAGKTKMDWSIAYFNLTENFIRSITAN